MGTIQKKLTDNLDKYKFYQLCYIDEIPKTYYDMTPKSKELYESIEYQKYQKKQNDYISEIMNKQGYASGKDYNNYNREHDPHGKFNFNYQYYDNPDYLAGFTHYLYFTSNMTDQWGDDWDDAPYEHNADLPYDDETDILMIPINLEDIGEFQCDFPDSHGINSHYSVDMINAGAVPWVFIYKWKRKAIYDAIHLDGGDTVETVIKKLKLLKSWIKS